MRDDQEFKNHAGEALTLLYRELIAASDDYDFAARRDPDTITIEFKRRPAKFVITSRPGTRQVCLSADGKSYRLDWDVVENTFVLTATGHTLREVLEEAISRHLGEEVTL